MICNFQSCGVVLELQSVRQHLEGVHRVRKKGDDVECLHEGCERTYSTMTSLMSHLRTCKLRPTSDPTSSNLPQASTSRTVEISSADAGVGLSIALTDSQSSGPGDCTLSVFPVPVMDEKVKVFEDTLKRSLSEQRRSHTTEKQLTANTINFEKLLGCTKDIVVSSLNIPNEIQCAESSFLLVSRIIQEQGTTHRRDKSLLKNEFYVEPETLIIDKILTKGKRKHNSELVYENVEVKIIPILKTLAALHRNAEWRRLCYSESDHTCTDGMYKNICCGSTFKNGKFSLLPENSLIIQLYNDGFSPADGMKSNSSTYTVGVIYFRVLNLPMKLQSQMKNIHLAALYMERDFKANSNRNLNSVLNPIVQELKKLEEGVTFNFTDEEGEEQFVRVQGTLFSEAYDNLARHKMSGLVESFSTR